MRKCLYALAFVALATGAIAIVPEAAFAQTALPWETPLETLTNSIKGPVAYFISLLGIVVAGAMLIFGGEINEFVRRLIMLVLVISLIIFASNVLSTLFSSGAGFSTYDILAQPHIPRALSAEPHSRRRARVGADVGASVRRRCCVRS